MIRFLNVDEKLIEKLDKNSDYLIMDETIWKQGRDYFKKHRNVDKVPVKDTDGKFTCYAFQDTDANRELRMLEELCVEENVLHFEDVYPEYDCVSIQECNELAYFFAKYLQGRGITVKVNGKYWNQIAKWDEQDIQGQALTIYAEGTWAHSQDLSYELLRSVSVEFEYIDHIYKENIKQGNIVNAKCNYREWIEELRGRNIILMGTGNMVQDTYDMLVAEGLDIAAFLGDTARNDLRLLGKEVIGAEDIGKYTNPVFIEVRKNSAFGLGHLDEYVYYGCRRNEDYFFFQDYAQVQRNNLQHVLQEKRIVLVGERLLFDYLKQNMIDRGKESDSIQYLGEEGFVNDDAIGVVVVLQMFGVNDSNEKWKQEIDLCMQKLRASNIESYTLYFTMTSSLVRIESRKEKYTIRGLRPKGILIGAINAFSGNAFFRDCIDNHPDIIQFNFLSLENDIFWYCVCCAQMPVDEAASRLLCLCRQKIGEEWFPIGFPDTDFFLAKCDEYFKGLEAVTPQELFVIFVVAYNEMMGREVRDISQTYIYWEPHMQDVPMKLLYADWLADDKTKSFAIYLTRDSLISAGSALKYTYRTHQKLDFAQMMYIMLTSPCILDTQEESDTRIILKFEDLKLTPRETWQKFCGKLGISWSDTLLQTTRFGKDSYFSDGVNRVFGYDLAPVYRNHADLFSFFDKMRICFCKAEYQKRYGYPYDDISFTRKELQELYLREFKCQDVLEINVKKEDDEYFRTYKWIEKRLNEVCISLFWDKLMEKDAY